MQCVGYLDCRVHADVGFAAQFDIGQHVFGKGEFPVFPF